MLKQLKKDCVASGTMPKTQQVISTGSQSCQLATAFENLAKNR